MSMTDEQCRSPTATAPHLGHFSAGAFASRVATVSLVLGMVRKLMLIVTEVRLGS
jgi:hypothetical protein